MLLLMTALPFVSCKKEKKLGQLELSVITNKVPDSDISVNKAVLTGTVTIKNATSEEGKAWFQVSKSESSLPLAEKQGEQSIPATGGEISFILYDLTPLTDYCYRACASIDGETVYGETHFFTTRQGAVEIKSVVFTNLYSESVANSSLGETTSRKFSGKVDIDAKIPSGTFVQQPEVCFLLAETEAELNTNPERISAGKVNPGGGTFSSQSYPVLKKWGTRYFYKAEVTLYGESFTSDTYVFLSDGAMGVDLGLSILWGNVNLGAHAIEENGDYYAWGETKPKERYTQDTYVYTGNPTTLPSDHDAANWVLKGNWRMPTEAEFQELVDNCKAEWVTYKGKEGCRFTSKKSGYTDRWIFLPATERRDDVAGGNGDGSGCYWSSSLNVSYPDRAHYFHVKKPTGGSNIIFQGSYARYVGLSVRPVIKK